MAPLEWPRRSLRWWLLRLTLLIFGFVYMVLVALSHKSASSIEFTTSLPEEGLLSGFVLIRNESATELSANQATTYRPLRRFPAAWSLDIHNTTRRNDTLDPYFQNVPLEYTRSIQNDKLWIRNSTLPRWLSDYMTWHSYQRTIWSPQKFPNQRWMVMQCLRSDTNCGGTADRLKPILWGLRMAYQTRRILLIHWTRPALLQEFLLPPQGGFDWRAPKWLAQEV